jgi:hypothetical protein
MPSVQIITMLITPDTEGFEVSPYISNFNNIVFDRLEEYQEKARQAAQKTLKPNG